MLTYPDQLNLNQHIARPNLKLNSDCPVQFVTKNIENLLIRLICKSDYVIGCVAWLTHGAILSTLSNCQGVSIIVNKERFLRYPEYWWHYQILESYTKLNPINKRPTAIRCIGDLEHKAKMHHKFLIFLRRSPHGKFNAMGMISGSFNLTNSASYSCENTMFVQYKPAINDAIAEYKRLLKYSESYNSFSDNFNPIPF